MPRPDGPAAPRAPAPCPARPGWSRAPSAPCRPSSCRLRRPSSPRRAPWHRSSDLRHERASSACLPGSSCRLPWPSPSGLIDLRAAALRDAHALAVLQQLRSDAGGLLRVRIDQRQVGDVDAAVLLHYPALRRRRVAAPLVVPLERHELLHDGALLVVIDLKHLARLALLDLAVDHRLLDGDDDHVADGGVPALGAAEHLDAGDLLRARVVGHIEDRRHLDHMTWPSGFTWTSPSALTRTSATRQRFSFDIVRVSTMRTLSPGFADWCSSWHLYFFFSVRYLPYWPCLARRSTCTTTVFVILLERTVPMRVFGRPRCSVCCAFSLMADPSFPRRRTAAASAPPSAAPCCCPSSA